LRAVERLFSAARFYTLRSTAAAMPDSKGQRDAMRRLRQPVMIGSSRLGLEAHLQLPGELRA
jgi:hypothetical protein